MLSLDSTLPLTAEGKRMGNLCHVRCLPVLLGVVALGACSRRCVKPSDEGGTTDATVVRFEAYVEDLMPAVRRMTQAVTDTGGDREKLGRLIATAPALRAMPAQSRRLLDERHLSK